MREYGHRRTADRLAAKALRPLKRTSRRHMPIHSLSFSVLPTSTSRLEGEIIFILVTRRSMISIGIWNSSTMQMGMAPPHGCAVRAAGGAGRERDASA